MLHENIAAYLAAQGVGTVGTDIFTGLMPEAPDAAIAIYETGGAPSIKTMTRVDSEQPTFQIAVRGAPETATAAAYDTARDLIQTIYVLLDRAQFTQSTIEYRWVEAQAPPFHLRRDERERSTFVCNFDAVKAVG